MKTTCPFKKFSAYQERDGEGNLSLLVNPSVQFDRLFVAKFGGCYQQLVVMHLTDSCDIFLSEIGQRRLKIC